MTSHELQDRYDALITQYTNETNALVAAEALVALAKTDKITSKLKAGTTADRIDLMLRTTYDTKPAEPAIAKDVARHPEVMSAEQEVADAETALAMAEAAVKQAKARIALLEVQREALMIVSAAVRAELRAQEGMT